MYLKLYLVLSNDRNNLFIPPVNPFCMAQQLHILILEDCTEKGKQLESIAREFGNEKGFQIDVHYFADIYPGNTRINYMEYDLVMVSPNTIKFLGEQVARLSQDVEGLTKYIIPGEKIIE